MCEPAYPVKGDVPARLEGALGSTYGPWAAEISLAHVWWEDLADNPDNSLLQNTVDASLNLRYAATPTLSLAVGLNQTARTPFQNDAAGERFDPYDQDPTRFLLLGVTYERGPFVVDAAYVDGTLLSNDGSKMHLGSVGLGYRF